MGTDGARGPDWSAELPETDNNKASHKKAERVARKTHKKHKEKKKDKSTFEKFSMSTLQALSIQFYCFVLFAFLWLPPFVCLFVAML